MVSQNKKKLKKLLDDRNYNDEWFMKFNLYTRNINNYGLLLMMYKDTEKKSMRVKVINSCSVVFVVMTIFFAFEIAIATY